MGGVPKLRYLRAGSHYDNNATMIRGHSIQRLNFVGKDEVDLSLLIKLTTCLALLFIHSRTPSHQRSSPPMESPS